MALEYSNYSPAIKAGAKVDADVDYTDSVNTTDIKDGAVTNDKIADGAIDISSKIAGDVVGSNNIDASVVKIINVNISATQVKGLAGTPFQLVPPPGPGKGIIFEGASLKLVYGGSNGFTESGDNFVVRYTNGSGVILSETIETTGFIDQVANTVTVAIPAKDTIVAQTGIENQKLVLDNTGSEIGGNAANDNEVRLTIKYRVIQL